jgi:hypothetical protein
MTHDSNKTFCQSATRPFALPSPTPPNPQPILTEATPILWGLFPSEVFNFIDDYLSIRDKNDSLLDV